MRKFWLFIGLICLSALGTPADETIAEAQTVAAAPKHISPLEIARYVRNLLGAGRIDDARQWYFRGLIRAGVEEALGEHAAHVTRGQHLRERLRGGETRLETEGGSLERPERKRSRGFLSRERGPRAAGELLEPAFVVAGQVALAARVEDQAA